tara:strand:- start:18601 stop:18942 length:342 start_codon:yes stop_codon:yes gene_type:complete
MASLTGRAINSSYKDLITISGSTVGQGVESSLKQLFDGEGEGSALSLSTTDIGVRGNFLTDSVTDFVFKISGGSTVFSILNSGVVKLKEQTSTPTGIEGGLYYKDNQLFLGIQ